MPIHRKELALALSSFKHPGHANQKVHSGGSMGAGERTGTIAGAIAGGIAGARYGRFSSGGLGPGGRLAMMGMGAVSGAAWGSFAGGKVGRWLQHGSMPRKRRLRRVRRTKELAVALKAVSTETQLEQVRHAFSAEFNGRSSGIVGEYKYYYPKEIYLNDGYLICEDRGEFYRVDFTKKDGDYEFTPKEDWKEVEQTYVAKSLGELLVTLKYNRFHDRLGRFARTAGGAVRGAISRGRARRAESKRLNTARDTANRSTVGGRLGERYGRKIGALSGLRQGALLGGKIGLLSGHPGGVVAGAATGGALGMLVGSRAGARVGLRRGARVEGKIRGSAKLAKALYGKARPGVGQALRKLRPSASNRARKRAGTRAIKKGVKRLSSAIRRNPRRTRKRQGVRAIRRALGR